MKLFNNSENYNQLKRRRREGPFPSRPPPIKRIVQMSKAASTLIDATFGRKCKAVIITDSEYIVLSALTTETIASRMEESKDE